MNKVSIIVPVYCNADTLLELYDKLRYDVLPKLPVRCFEYELIFVDDGSTDSSWNDLRLIYMLDDHTRIIKLAKNYGEHKAILCGYSYATGDCIINISADLQEPSKLILDMIDAWKCREDATILAVRVKREDDVRTQLFANLYYFLVRHFAFKEMPKHGFNIALVSAKTKAAVLRSCKLRPVFEAELLSINTRFICVPYTRLKRTKGESKWTLSKKLKCTFDTLLNYSDFMSCASLFNSGIITGTVILSVIFRKLGLHNEMLLSFIMLIILSCIQVAIAGTCTFYTLSLLREAVNNEPMFTVLTEINKDNAFDE